MNREEAVKALIAYAEKKGFAGPEDEIFLSNQLYDVLGIEVPDDFTPDSGAEAELEEILAALLDDAQERGRIEGGVVSRDLFDTRIMGLLAPRPSAVIHTFWEKYEDSPEAATDYFYALCRDLDYIRTYRVKKDRKWEADTRYGKLDITINLSKPEKDPKAIAAALKMRPAGYPKCLLCPQNEGYAGRLNHPARQTIRLIPLTLGGEKWYMQYSPYVYYNEHCIVLSAAHEPMKISRETFVRLLEFVGLFPHYTVGSNADLPIVGGSILSHEHFQGGRYTFAMARAGIRTPLTFPEFPDIEAGIVEWPLSVIRLDGEDPARITALADKILTAWRTYSDPAQDILAESDGAPHNTITPIARMRDGKYELDLVLRNNRTTEEYPLGIFHPHEELHHIKKENIGLIEVMGLAVLPARLLGEMQTLTDTILAGKALSEEPAIAAHVPWAERILADNPGFAGAGEAKREELQSLLEAEIGKAFAEVLACCGVFKETADGQAAFKAFAESI